MFRNVFATAAISAALMSIPAFAQEDYTSYRGEASVMAMGSFVKQTTNDKVGEADMLRAEYDRSVAAAELKRLSGAH